MNSAAWWFACENDDDVKFYRRHIVKSPAVIDWIQEQRGCHYDVHDVGEEEPKKELTSLFTQCKSVDKYTKNGDWISI